MQRKLLFLVIALLVFATATPVFAAPAVQTAGEETAGEEIASEETDGERRGRRPVELQILAINDFHGAIAPVPET